MTTPVELTIAGSARSPSSLRLVATLGIAGLCSGFLLSASHQVTKPIIDANKAEQLRQSVYEVVPGSSAVQRLVYRDGSLTPIGETEKTALPVLFAAYDDSSAFRGYGIMHQGAGFADQIVLIYGFEPGSQHIVGMRVLSSKETPGLGDKIYKSDAFVSNFEGLEAGAPIVVVKDGRDADNEVDAITGATISSKSVVRIINESVTFWKDKLPAPGSEPPAPRPGEGGTP